MTNLVKAAITNERIMTKETETAVCAAVVSFAIWNASLPFKKETQTNVANGKKSMVER